MCVYVEVGHVPIISPMLNRIYGESSIFSKGPHATQCFFFFSHYYCVNFRRLQNVGTLTVSLGVVCPTNSVY